MTNVEITKIADPKVKWFGNCLAAAIGIAFCLWLLSDQLGWIDRYAFDWPSFATLVTGASAVAGAVWIGTMQIGITDQQVKIAERQSKIMEQQVSVQRLTLKTELYDRRIKILADVRSYAQTLNKPSIPISKEKKNYIHLSIESCSFIFNNEIYLEAMSIYALINDLHEKLSRYIYSQGPYEDGFHINEEMWKTMTTPVAEKISKLTDSIMPFMRLDEGSSKI